MPPRFYCSRPITPNAPYTLPPEVAHHASRVLRLGLGDRLVLFDGGGGEYPAVIESSGAQMVVSVGAFDVAERESPLAITLYQALPTGDKMDLIIQKAVELGVHDVVPITALRCVMKLTGERAAKRVAHWRGVAVSACEQCGRNRVPQVSEVMPLATALAECKAPHRYMLAPGASLRPSMMEAPTGAIALFIGPEGGWSDAELAAGKAAGCLPLSLGPRVLRTETAGPAALSAFAARFGDF
ncbi:MAG: hypothetical protein RIR70_542 [Pseudomonadota bacterium]